MLFTGFFSSGILSGRPHGYGRTQRATVGSRQAHDEIKEIAWKTQIRSGVEEY